MAVTHTLEDNPVPMPYLPDNQPPQRSLSLSLQEDPRQREGTRYEHSAFRPPSEVSIMALHTETSQHGNFRPSPVVQADQYGNYRSLSFVESPQHGNFQPPSLSQLPLQGNAAPGFAEEPQKGHFQPLPLQAPQQTPQHGKLRTCPLIIPQSYIVHNHHGLDSVAAWSKPVTVAQGAPRRPPLLDDVVPTHSDEADIDALDGISLNETIMNKDAPFANNQRQRVVNPAARQRRKRKRKHQDCFGVFLFLFVVLASLAGYGYALWLTKFWERDSSVSKFRIPSWAHPLIVTFIMVEIILLIAFIGRWLKSYRR